MSKRENYFPIGIYGHRVRELKKSRGLTNAELYDVMDIGVTDEYSSKNRAVNHALKNPNYRHIKNLHDYFNVSADYLLGIDEGHAGLSEEAENYLQAMKSNHPNELRALDLMLRNGSGLLEVLTRIADVDRFCQRKAELETTLAFFNREASELIDSQPDPVENPSEDPEQLMEQQKKKQQEFLKKCQRVEKKIRETEEQLKAIGNDTTYVATAYDAAMLFSSMLRNIMPEDRYIRDPKARPVVEDLRAEDYQLRADLMDPDIMHIK